MSCKTAESATAQPFTSCVIGSYLSLGHIKPERHEMVSMDLQLVGKRAMPQDVGQIEELTNP
jgi:hypothetical protein